VGAVPRQVPDQVWYLKPSFVMMVGGVLPFGAVFVEVFFILSSLWMNYYYYVFGFLLLAFVILIVTCAEIAIVLTYFQVRGLPGVRVCGLHTHSAGVPTALRRGLPLVVEVVLRSWRRRHLPVRVFHLLLRDPLDDVPSGGLAVLRLHAVDLHVLRHGVRREWALRLLLVHAQDFLGREGGLE